MMQKCPFWGLKSVKNTVFLYYFCMKWNNFSQKFTTFVSESPPDMRGWSYRLGVGRMCCIAGSHGISAGQTSLLATNNYLKFSDLACTRPKCTSRNFI